MFEKIVIKLETRQPEIKLISVIRKITGMSISKIKYLITNQKPIFEGVLFYNDHGEKEKVIRGLINQLSSLNVQLKIYNMLESENLDEIFDISQYEVKNETLLNYLDENKNDLERYYGELQGE